MRIRTFHPVTRPLGSRLKSLLALPGLEATIVVSGPVELAVTDDPALAADLHRDFVGKLPVWLDLNAEPESNGKLPLQTRRERAGIAVASLITVPTRGLWESVREMTHRVLLVPDPIAPTAPAPVSPTLVTPAIGYIGSASPYWDAELIINLATIARDLAIHIGGDCAENPIIKQAERNLPNLHLHPDAGPGFWRKMSVAIFPYRVDAATHRWLPLPLLEAWGAGVPSVVTPLMEIGRLSVPVVTAVTASGFYKSISALLADPQSADRVKQASAFIEVEHAPSKVSSLLRSNLDRLCKAVV